MEFIPDTKNTPEEYKKILFWQNGKTEKSIIEILITKEINTYKKLKEAIIYEKNLPKSTYEKMKIYNNLQIEIDDTDVDNLKPKDMLYISLDGSKFTELNYINQYEILEFIKSGGYGEVLLAKNKITNKKVSIKKIDLNGFSTEELYSISREALYLSSLQHKNIIKIYGSFAYKNYLYNVMEYAEGGELTQLIRSNEELSENRIKDIFKQIYEGVQFIHENEVIHRDLKPNNILFLDKEKTHVVIIDFGISGIANGRSREIIKAGTIKYIPPEMTSGDHFQSSSKIDIWALGVILYLMNFKIFPFDGNDNDVMEKIAFEPLKFPTGIKIKKSLIKLINGMMEKNANRRIDILDPLFENWYNDNSNDYQVFKKKSKDDKYKGFKIYSPIKKRSKISDELLKSPFQIKQMPSKKVGRRFSQKDFDFKEISPIKSAKTKK